MSTRIEALSGLSATIDRDGDLKSIVIEYDPALAGIIDDATFYDKLAYKVYDELTADETTSDSYDVEFREELKTFVWTITPSDSGKSYSDVWADLYQAIVVAPAEAAAAEDEGEDEDPDPDEDEPKKKDKPKDPPKKDKPKKDPPKKSKDDKDDEDEDDEAPPKKDKPKKKTPPKKDANGTYYDTDDGRYHSDDADIEEGLDEFYTLLHASSL